jgi:hypothetical protein
MYVTAPDFGLEDFLKAVNFIAPGGTSLDYFIVPSNQKFNLPSGANYSTQVSYPDDESITYRKTEPLLKQDMADTPMDYSFWDPKPMGRKNPTARPLPKSTEPDELESPFVKVLSESTELVPEDIQLREKWEMFPKGTILHFSKKSIRESAGRKYTVISSGGPISDRANQKIFDTREEAEAERKILASRDRRIFPNRGRKANYFRTTYRVVPVSAEREDRDPAIRELVREAKERIEQYE